MWGERCDAKGAIDLMKNVCPTEYEANRAHVASIAENSRFETIGRGGGIFPSHASGAICWTRGHRDRGDHRFGLTCDAAAEIPLVSVILTPLLDLMC